MLIYFCNVRHAAISRDNIIVKCHSFNVGCFFYYIANSWNTSNIEHKDHESYVKFCCRSNLFAYVSKITSSRGDTIIGMENIAEIFAGINVITTFLVHCNVTHQLIMCVV